MDRFKRCQILFSHFWGKWSREYLSQLQKRQKWQKSEPNLEAGELVLVMKEFLPPTHWKSARFIQTLPGKDGLVRAAELFDGQKEFMRNVRKLSEIPIDNEIVTADIKNADSVATEENASHAQSATPSGSSSSDQITRAAKASGSSLSDRAAVNNEKKSSSKKNDSGERPVLRRSSRIRNKTLGLNFTLLCLVGLIMPSVAMLTVKQIESDRLFTHHKKTVVPTKGKISVQYTSDLFVSKVVDRLKVQTHWFGNVCRRMPNPHSWEACLAYRKEISEHFGNFKLKTTQLKTRVKRSRGIVGHIVHTLKIFFLGDDDEIDDLERKEREHFHQVREVPGNIVQDNMREKSELMRRDAAVQSELDKDALDSQIG